MGELPIVHLQHRSNSRPVTGCIGPPWDAELCHWATGPGNDTVTLPYTHSLCQTWNLPSCRIHSSHVNLHRLRAAGKVPPVPPPHHDLTSPTRVVIVLYLALGLGWCHRGMARLLCDGHGERSCLLPAAMTSPWVRNIGEGFLYFSHMYHR